MFYRKYIFRSPVVTHFMCCLWRESKLIGVYWDFVNTGTIYTVLSISRGKFSQKNSEKTPHGSLLCSPISTILWDVFSEFINWITFQLSSFRIVLNIVLYLAVIFRKFKVPACDLSHWPWNLQTHVPWWLNVYREPWNVWSQLLCHIICVCIMMQVPVFVMVSAHMIRMG